MPVEIFAQTTASYSDALTIGPSQQVQAVQWNVSAPYAATYQIAKQKTDGTVDWDTAELTAQPGQGGYPVCHGIRFRNFEGGVNSTTVLCDGYFSDDPLPAGFIAGTAIFSTNGKSGTGMLTGAVAADGTLVSGSGFTPVKNSTGNYTITFTSDFVTVPNIGITYIQGVINSALISPDVVTLSVHLLNFQVYDRTGSPTDTPFQFFAQPIS